MAPAIDPSFSLSGPQWQIARPAPADGPVADATPPEGASAPRAGFGDVLATQVDRLAQTQTDAASAAVSLSTGQASDPEAVVMSVERARLAMQLAAQIRTRSVEAVQDLFHTQV